MSNQCRSKEPSTCRHHGNPYSNQIEEACANADANSYLTARESQDKSENKDHLVVAEISTESGYRYWTKPMPAPELDKLIAEEEKKGGGLSEYVCSQNCWCEQ